MLWYYVSGVDSKALYELVSVTGFLLAESTLNPFLSMTEILELLICFGHYRFWAIHKLDWRFACY